MQFLRFSHSRAAAAALRFNFSRSFSSCGEGTPLCRCPHPPSRPLRDAGCRHNACSNAYHKSILVGARISQIEPDTVRNGPNHVRDPFKCRRKSIIVVRRNASYLMSTSACRIYCCVCVCVFPANGYTRFDVTCNSNTRQCSCVEGYKADGVACRKCETLVRILVFLPSARGDRVTILRVAMIIMSQELS